MRILLGVKMAYSNVRVQTNIARMGESLGGGLAQSSAKVFFLKKMGSLFIGKLPDGFEREDLEKAFSKFGKVTRADVKRGPASNFGFVEVRVS